ncbi:MAG: hypothetical protein Q8R04_04025 [Nanoarchaeota archaeon]|nr:hypothetical protein [Nanoarchaeota archaeon]
MAKTYTTEYFYDIIRQELSKNRFNSLQTNKEHDNYVDLISNQFYMNGRLLLETGFKTILFEPLFDLNEYLSGSQCKNFDLLVHNHQLKQSIFIEVKSGFSSIATLLTDFEDTVRVVKEKFDEKLAPLLKLKIDEHDSVEFVLVLPRNQSLEVIGRISEQDKNEIIVWTISEITKHTLKHDLSNISQLLAKKRTHKNGKLRECLYNEVSLYLQRTMNCMLNSDPCQKLEYYLPQIQRCKLEKFNFTDIKSRIFDQDINFDRYSKPEDAKKYIFDQLIKNLKDMELVTIEKETGNVLENSYSLNIDKRWIENKVKKHIISKFFEMYLKKKEGEIQAEALKRAREYQSQKDLTSMGLGF